MRNYNILLLGDNEGKDMFLGSVLPMGERGGDVGRMIVKYSVDVRGIMVRFMSFPSVVEWYPVCGDFDCVLIFVDRADIRKEEIAEYYRQGMKITKKETFRSFIIFDPYGEEEGISMFDGRKCMSINGDLIYYPPVMYVKYDNEFLVGKLLRIFADIDKVIDKKICCREKVGVMNCNKKKKEVNVDCNKENAYNKGKTLDKYWSINNNLVNMFGVRIETFNCVRITPELGGDKEKLYKFVKYIKDANMQYTFEKINNESVIVFKSAS